MSPGGDIESFKDLPLEKKFVALGLNFLNSIRKTQMLRFAEMSLQTECENLKADLMAVTTIVGAGVSYLVCRPRRIRCYNGIDLESDDSWQRMESAIEQIANGVMHVKLYSIY